MYVAGSIGFFYSAAVLFHFVNVFPRHTKIGNNKKLILSLYLITFAGVILYDLKIYYYAYPILCGLMLTAGMIIVLRSYFVLHSPETKTQVRVILYGTGLALATFPVLYFGPMLLTGGRVFSAYVPMISSVLLPLSMAFAIMRYRLMDIDTLFDNTLIYATTLLLLVLADVGLVNILIHSKVIPTNNFLFILISVWFIIFAYIPVRNFVQNIMKKLLKREIYDINAVSLQLSKELLSASGIEDAFRKVNFAIGNAMHPRGGNAYLVNPNGGVVPVWEENEIPTPRIDIDKITTLAAPVHLSVIVEAKNLPAEYAGGIYVPIIGSQRQIGYFVFQNKHSDRLYDNNDIKLLGIASNQLAMAVEALKAQENAAQERERISREVHDCVGNSFAQAIFISDTINKNTDNANILKYSQNLKNILSTGLDNTRDLLWAVEKNENSLGNLISYICNKICVTTNSFESRCMSDSIEDDRIILSSIVRLNIIRIIEEATSNIIKHAKAAKLEIIFVQKGKDFTITIKDNGIGFDLSQENKSPNGYGLRNIRKRCDEIGAHLDIESSNAGTQITVNLRLN
jgi:signal transduction histidine kinase